MNSDPCSNSLKRRSLLRTLSLTALAIGCSYKVSAESAPGTFGFIANVDADGVFNPRLKSVTVQSVVPRMPAAMAGIATGDLVIEVDGKAVSGAAASEMKLLMNKKPGEKLSLKLRRGTAEFSVNLIAVHRP